MPQEPEEEGGAAFDPIRCKVPFSQWSEEQKEAYVLAVVRRRRDLAARRRAVVDLMEWRGIAVTLMNRARLDACSSEELLLTWLIRAANVHTSADVFVPE